MEKREDSTVSSWMLRLAVISGFALIVVVAVVFFLPERRLRNASKEFDALVTTLPSVSSASAAFSSLQFDYSHEKNAGTNREVMTGYLGKSLPQAIFYYVAQKAGFSPPRSRRIGTIVFQSGKFDSSENFVSREKLTSATVSSKLRP